MEATPIIKKDLFVFDMWVGIALVILTKMVTPSPTENLTPIGTVVSSALIPFSIVFFAAIIIILFFCSRLKKHRYLVVYMNCQKIGTLGKATLFVLVVMAAFVIINTDLSWTIKVLPAVIISAVFPVRIVDSEDKI